VCLPLVLMCRGLSKWNFCGERVMEQGLSFTFGCVDRALSTLVQWGIERD